jgi:hypothetical protein
VRKTSYALVIAVSAISLLAGCSGKVPAGSGDGAAAVPGATMPAGTHQLAIKDCAEAAALFGDKLQGMELMDMGDEQRADRALGCVWNTPPTVPPVLSRSIQLQVILGPHLAKNMMSEQAIQLSGMKRIPAPAFDKLGGLAFGQPIGNSQFSAQLPDAQVILVTIAGPEVPPAQYVTDAIRVDVAQKLLGL